MTIFEIFSILIVSSALFAYINSRFIKLPSSIGLMVIALFASLIIVLTGKIFSETTGSLIGFFRL